MSKTKSYETFLTNYLHTNKLSLLSKYKYDTVRNLPMSFSIYNGINEEFVTKWKDFIERLENDNNFKNDFVSAIKQSYDELFISTIKQSYDMFKQSIPERYLNGCCKFNEIDFDNYLIKIEKNKIVVLFTSNEKRYTVCQYYLLQMAIKNMILSTLNISETFYEIIRSD